MNKIYQVAEVKLSYRTKPTKSERVQISNSKDCYKVLLDNWDEGELEHKESFKMLLLNQANFVLGVYTVAEGGIASIQIDIRIILQAALLSNASSIVLAHNHPSGQLKPSGCDCDMTKGIILAASALQIRVYDHIIVCRDKYFSFADEGILYKGIGNKS